MLKERNLINTRIIWSILLILIIIINLNVFIVKVIAQGHNKYQRVRGFSKKEGVNPNDSVLYEFDNNLVFRISTDSYVNLDVRYENQLRDREIHVLIENRNNPLSLEVDNRQNLRNYGISQGPKEPTKGANRYQNTYNTFFKFVSNASIDQISFRFKKDELFGLDAGKTYSLALFKPNQDSWDLIETSERLNESSSEIYLEGSMSGLSAGTEYYITLYEVIPPSYDWIFIVVLVIIGVISAIILISKRDYIHYLRTRQTPIEKGAHRMSLDEVLENENRNKIIDFILNEPGIHFNELLRKTELAAGNLVWHLDILETYKIIGKKRIGNFVAYFPYFQKNPISNINLKLSKSKLTLEVLEMIEAEPGVWNNVITKRLKVDHKTIHYHIKKLIDLGLIVVKKEGRKKKLFPNLDSEFFINDNIL